MAMKYLKYVNTYIKRPIHLLLNKLPHLFSILVPHRALTTYLFQAVYSLVEVTRKYFLKIKKIVP